MNKHTHTDHRCNIDNDHFVICSGKKEAESCRQQLMESLKHAKSIARLTPELEKEFREVCVTD